jgi:hypothetical protein
MALQINTPLEDLSISSKIVDPVVVIPDIDSKKASVKESCKDEYINGKEANKVMAIQEKEVIIKACLMLRLFSSVWFVMSKRNPIKMEKKDQNKKL